MKDTLPAILDPKPSPPMQLRARTMRCIALIILEDTPTDEAIRVAGIHKATLPAAIKKPAVQKYIKALHNWKKRQDLAERQAFIGDAIDAARDIAINAQNESVRMRAIEFLKRELDGPECGIQAPQSAPPAAPDEGERDTIQPGYVFTRPDQPTDSQSAGVSDESEQIQGLDHDV